MSAVAKASPTRSVRSASRKYETCPTEWPGVWIQRQAGKLRHGAVLGQGLDPRAQGLPLRGQKAREEGDRPAGRGIGGGIVALARPRRGAQARGRRSERRTPWRGSPRCPHGRCGRGVSRIARRFGHAEAPGDRVHHEGRGPRHTGVDEDEAAVGGLDRVEVHEDRAQSSRRQRRRNGTLVLSQALEFLREGRAAGRPYALDGTPFANDPPNLR